MRNLLRLAIGAAYIVIAASALGFTVNALRPEGLPVVRKPLSTTRKHVTQAQIESHAPLVGPTAAPTAPPKPGPAATGPVASQPTKPNRNLPATPSPNSTQTRPPAANPKEPSHPVKTPPTQTPAKPQAGFAPSIQYTKGVFDDKRALFLDARAAADYEAEHIPGALSLYVEDLDKLYDRVLGKVPKDQLIITYCSDPECGKGIKLADVLVEKGFTRVMIFLEGLPAWKKAGYPTATGKEPGR